jgi:hypothetical protein
VLGVRVANVLKVKAAVEADEPARERVEHLGQRGVHVKIVLPPEVLGGEAAKVDLVEDDLVGVRDAPEAHDEG